MELKNWNARRSGAFITVNGIDTTSGAAASLTGIVRIEAAPEAAEHRCDALGKDGEKHKLI